MKESKDKRSFPRVAISLNVHIHDSEKQETAEMVDLTVHGISFKLEQSFPIGSKIFIDIDETPEIRKNKLKGEVLRCNHILNVTPSQHLVAAKFVKVNDEFLMDILDLIQKKIKNSERPEFGIHGRRQDSF